MEIATIGLDLAKHVFQVHGVDQEGRTVIRRKLRRVQVIGFFAKLPPCLVGREACGTAHYGARELRALGHDVRLMPAHDVKAYVKRNKNDAADAEAIREAVTRPTMRFVPVKTEAQQAVLVLHRTRELLVSQRTQTINALRGHDRPSRSSGAEGTPGPCPGEGAGRGWPSSASSNHKVSGMSAGCGLILRTALVPEPGRTILDRPATRFDEIEKRTATIDHEILGWHRVNPVSLRLAKIPGIGPLIASALAATVPDATVLRSGREFAAWQGLVPRQRSTGGKRRMGRISRQGDRYLRRLLIIGAQSALLRSKAVRESSWVQGLLGRCARLKVAVALANKTARIAWVIMAKGEVYRRAATA